MYLKHRYCNIFYEKIGENKDVILILPGWGNTRKTFHNIIENLKENYTIYILDYPGFGKSSEIKQEMSIYDYADILRDFLKKEKIKNPIVIAHSFGGRITSILQGKYKIPMKKIVLMDVAGIKRRKKLSVYLKEKTYKFLKKIVKILKRKDLEEKLLKLFASPDYQAIPDHMRKTFQNIIGEDLRKYYQEIKVETLIIWGEKDKDTPLKDALLLKKIIKNSGLIVYKGASHFSYLEEPYQTNNILKVFLKKEDMD